MDTEVHRDCSSPLQCSVSSPQSNAPLSSLAEDRQQSVFPSEYYLYYEYFLFLHIHYTIPEIYAAAHFNSYPTQPYPTTRTSLGVCATGIRWHHDWLRLTFYSGYRATTTPAMMQEDAAAEITGTVFDYFNANQQQYWVQLLHHYA